MTYVNLPCSSNISGISGFIFEGQELYKSEKGVSLNRFVPRPLNLVSMLLLNVRLRW